MIANADDGFWFHAEGEQKDLDASEYGQTVGTKEFVNLQIKFLPRADSVICHPAFWWSRQDPNAINHQQIRPAHSRVTIVLRPKSLAKL